MSHIRRRELKQEFWMELEEDAVQVQKALDLLRRTILELRSAAMPLLNDPKKRS